MAKRTGEWWPGRSAVSGRWSGVLPSPSLSPPPSGSWPSLRRAALTRRDAGGFALIGFTALPVTFVLTGVLVGATIRKRR